MNAKAFPLDDIAPSVTHLAGRTPDDPDLRNFLGSIGSWPLAAFPADEFDVYFEDHERGFSLSFRDAATLKHPAAEGKPPRTAIFIGGFFYSQGKDGYQQFKGALPHGVSWSDTPQSLQGKLGVPKFVITNKKTGAVQAHRWEIDGLMLSANFKNDGSIGHVYVGVR
jgi:hypothetical protein